MTTCKIWRLPALDSSRPVVLILPDGQAEAISHPVTVEEVLSLFPHCCISSPQRGFWQPPRQLPPDKILHTGRTYFVQQAAAAVDASASSAPSIASSDAAATALGGSFAAGLSADSAGSAAVADRTFGLTLEQRLRVRDASSWPPTSSGHPNSSSYGGCLHPEMRHAGHDRNRGAAAALAANAAAEMRQAEREQQLACGVQPSCLPSSGRRKQQQHQRVVVVGVAEGMGSSEDRQMKGAAAAASSLRVDEGEGVLLGRVAAALTKAEQEGSGRGPLHDSLRGLNRMQDGTCDSKAQVRVCIERVGEDGEAEEGAGEGKEDGEGREHGALMLSFARHEQGNGDAGDDVEDEEEDDVMSEFSTDSVSSLSGELSTCMPLRNAFCASRNNVTTSHRRQSSVDDDSLSTCSSLSRDGDESEAYNSELGSDSDDVAASSREDDSQEDEEDWGGFTPSTYDIVIDEVDLSNGSSGGVSPQERLVEEPLCRSRIRKRISQSKVKKVRRAEWTPSLVAIFEG